jgi:exopolyphosphatase / guanosine-5'-triphosphate,3'-diphosphate pyrophosphatase
MENTNASQELLAAIDLGSNSFRLLIAKHDGGQIVSVSTYRESVRLAGGLTDDQSLSEQKVSEATDALARFRERLSGVSAHRVRAVATSTYRVAKNAKQLLQASEAALGFPIDVVSGQEEARLIYLGCAHTLPWSDSARLIVDIGGGSTEFIIGTHYDPELTESFQLGAVTLSEQLFPSGNVTNAGFRKAEMFVRSRLEVLNRRYKQGWNTAYGSSGTIRALHEIIVENKFDTSITVEGLQKLKEHLAERGHMDRVELSALKASRAPVLPGGLAILLGLMLELNIREIVPAEGALRLGVIYDMLEKHDAQSDADPRALTVARLQQRYDVDVEQSQRVTSLAQGFWRNLYGKTDDKYLEWTSAIHEIGMAISHEDYHKHGCYILQHSDLYGFSEQQRAELAILVLGHTGSLKKLESDALNEVALARLMCLRLACLIAHGRGENAFAGTLCVDKSGFELTVKQKVLSSLPLTEFLLEEEVAKWSKFGSTLRIRTT